MKYPKAITLGRIIQLLVNLLGRSETSPPALLLANSTAAPRRAHARQPPRRKNSRRDVKGPSLPTMADLAPMDQDEDMADGPPDDGAEGWDDGDDADLPAELVEPDRRQRRGPLLVVPPSPAVGGIDRCV